MGFHIWLDKCPHCNFEEMTVSSYNALYFEASCPMCGYERWTEEKIPDNNEIAFAKLKLHRTSIGKIRRKYEQ